MNLFNYDELMKFLENNHFGFYTRNFRESITLYINKEELEIVYPKLFRDDKKEIEILFFQKKGILIFHVDNVRDSVNYYQYKDLISCELIDETREGKELSLVAKFKNEISINLSDKDSNNSWRQEYIEKIKETFSLLIKVN